MNPSNFKTLGTYISGRDNNFNLIRLLAAALVLITHSFTLRGFAAIEIPILKVDSGGLAVAVFFITSGFLISMSYMNRQSTISYLEARALRIYPGLIVSVLFCTFIIGPIFSTLPVTRYLLTPAVYKFLVINSLLILDIVQLRYVLPQVFTNNPFAPTVNGSLWSLPYEMWMYILLLVLGSVKILSHRKWFNIFFVGFMLQFILGQTYFPNLGIVKALALYEYLTACFLSGVFFYVNKDHTPLHVFVLLFAWALVFLCRSTIFSGILNLFTVGYTVFWFAFVPAGHIRKFNNFGDYSYGVYIYAFPIQQTFLAIFHTMSPWLLLVCASITTLFFAVLSWRFVEKPALAYKGVLYKKGIALLRRALPSESLLSE